MDIEVEATHFLGLMLSPSGRPQADHGTLLALMSTMLTVARQRRAMVGLQVICSLCAPSYTSTSPSRTKSQMITWPLSSPVCVPECPRMCCTGVILFLFLAGVLPLTLMVSIIFVKSPRDDGMSCCNKNRSQDAFFSRAQIGICIYRCLVSSAFSAWPHASEHTLCTNMPSG